MYRTSNGVDYNSVDSQHSLEECVKLGLFGGRLESPVESSTLALLTGQMSKHSLLVIHNEIRCFKTSSIDSSFLIN